MPTLFFMPWVAIREPLQIGPISLLPYSRGEEPCPLGQLSQCTLDRILGNYGELAHDDTTQGMRPVMDATLLRWQGDDARDANLSDDEIADRMSQARLLVFSAIANRELSGPAGYCNSDRLSVIAQHFSEPNPSSVNVGTRRRYGGSSAGIGGFDKPIFLRPLHTDDSYWFNLDVGLANALLAMPTGDVRDRVQGAVDLFNRANSDAPEIPLSAESVLLRASLETLLASGHQTRHMRTALLDLLATHLGPVQWHEGEIPSASWKSRWSGLKPHPPIRALDAWICDFADARNAGAHGKGPTSHPPSVWSLQNHLLFASWFIPRIVKALLAKHGLYQVTPLDVEDLTNCEIFFAYDVMKVTDRQLHWTAALRRVQALDLRRQLYEATKG